MKVILTEDWKIKRTEYKAGDEIDIHPETAARLIENGIANRVIEAVENRVVGR